MSGIFDQIINYSPPLIVSGTVNYKGTWNASTNNPPLSNPPVASTKGDYYVVSTAGTQFSISFAVGDWIISSGTAWEKVDLTDAVSSVFGRTGAVVGVSTDYSAVGLTNTAIGAANPSTGAFTSLSSSSTTTLNGTTIPASKTLVVTTDKLSALAATTSAELAGVISDETGSGSLVFANSPTLVTPILGTPQSGTLTSCTGLPISTGVSGLGTGVATALAVNVGSAGAPVVNGGALGTPSSGTVTNLTGTASININGTVGATTPSTVAGTTGTFTTTSGSPILSVISSDNNGDVSAQIKSTGSTGSSQLIFSDTAATSGKLLYRHADDSLAVETGGAERARFTSTGLAVTGALSATGVATLSSTSNTVLMVGTSSSDANYRVRIDGGAGAALRTDTTADSTVIGFFRSGTNVGSISVTSSATTYSTSSDYRLKDITGPLANSGAFIDALKPKVGTWKSDGSKFVGFIAHEFAEVSPSSVVGEKDAVDAEGNPKFQAMQASSSEVIANLVAELQSLRARVAALESN